MVRAGHFAPHHGAGLKVARPDAEFSCIMAEADHTPPSRPLPSVPDGLLDALTAPPVIRIDEVARARQHAAARAYDDGEVVGRIAERLLSLSAR